MDAYINDTLLQMLIHSMEKSSSWEASQDIPGPFTEHERAMRPYPELRESYNNVRNKRLSKWDFSRSRQVVWRPCIATICFINQQTATCVQLKKSALCWWMSTRVSDM
jgi:hypothetical protein